jgi:hypothetical protein
LSRHAPEQVQQVLAEVAVVPAWTLWALALVACLVIPWLDQLLRQAGRPDLVQWNLLPGFALVSTATVGAVLASRRPAHPVGWLLLAQVASNLATGAAAQYLAWGLLAPVWRWGPPRWSPGR